MENVAMWRWVNYVIIAYIPYYDYVYRFGKKEIHNKEAHQNGIASFSHYTSVRFCGCRRGNAHALFSLHL
jgi:hypothetical protein